MIREFCRWLSATALSEHIQDIFWIIPTVQIVHIVSIAIVMTSMAMLDLRLVGVAGRRQSFTDMAGRFLPWVWTAVAVLLCSGSILIIGEPGRDLLNTVFWLKMSLLVAGLLLTWTFQHMLHRNHLFWDRNRVAAIALGSVSLVIWVGIVGCGRWIAYVEHG